MNWNTWMRQSHRWLSMIFTVFVLANIGVNLVPGGVGEIALWIGYSTLIPLILLLFSGLYLFALPYVAKRRVARRKEAAA